MSSQKLSCGMLETQPLSEPLEPLPDMQCDDSELSVAGGRQGNHSEDCEFGLNDHMHVVTHPSAETLVTQAHGYATLLSGPL